MRCVCSQGRAKVGALGVMAAIGGLSATPVQAAAHVFPADQALVPVAVAGAFALPALLAALYAGMKRMAGNAGAIVGFGVMAVVGLVIAGLLNPGLVSALKI